MVFIHSICCVEQMLPFDTIQPRSRPLTRVLSSHATLLPRHTSPTPPPVSSSKAYSLHLLHGADVAFMNTVMMFILARFMLSLVEGKETGTGIPSPHNTSYILHLSIIIYSTGCKWRPNRDQGLARSSRAEGASTRTDLATSLAFSAAGDFSHATSSEKRRSASAASPPAMAR